MLREEDGGQKKTHPCAEMREEEEQEGFKRKPTEEDGAEETRFSYRRFYPVFISPLPTSDLSPIGTVPGKPPLIANCRSPIVYCPLFIRPPTSDLRHPQTVDKGHDREGRQRAIREA